MIKSKRIKKTRPSPKNKVGYVLKDNDVNLKCYVAECEDTKKNMARLLKEMENEKNKSQKLAKDLEKFKLAIDNVSDHIIITDPDLKIIYVNRAVENITGFTPKDSLGKNPGELWGGHMPKEFYQKLWDTVKVKKQNFVGEMTNQRKNGEKYIVDAQIAPVLDEHGKIIYYIGIERDITGVKELEKIKSEFVAVVSHQLRTPLTSIKWYAQFLLQDKVNVLSGDQKEFVEQILNSNERMIKLVNDILNVARIETGIKFRIVKEKTDVVEILRQIYNEQSVLAQNKKIKIVFVPNLKGKLMISADPEKIQQVFQNLINNAVKYSYLNKKITISYKKVKNNFIFSVQDQGLGITQQQQKRIFEKFFRAENILAMDTDGTGLGLYIAKAIVEGHGGKISFKSKENEGTTFFVSLPG